MGTQRIADHTVWQEHVRTIVNVLTAETFQSQRFEKYRSFSSSSCPAVDVKLRVIDYIRAACTQDIGASNKQEVTTTRSSQFHNDLLLRWVLFGYTVNKCLDDRTQNLEEPAQCRTRI